MRAATLCLAAIIAAGLNVPAATPGPAPKGERPDQGASAGVWVPPTVDLSRYSKLYLRDQELVFRKGGATSAGTTSQRLSRDAGPYAFTEQEQERFEKVVREAFVAELGSGKVFQVVDTVVPGTLIVRARFLDITSDVPPEPARFDDTHLAAVGEATVTFELIDPQTGVIQTSAPERRSIRPQERVRGVNPAPANDATVWSDVARWAHQEGRALRRQLERAKTG